MRVKVKKCPIGGNLPGADKIVPLWGGEAQQLSSNPIDGGVTHFTGQSHDESTNGLSGIGIGYGNNQVEVEGGESATKSADGSINVWGRMKIPGSKMSFKTAIKKIANEENKATKLKNKSGEIMKGANPSTPYGSISHNTALVLEDAADQRHKLLAIQKEDLANTQNELLQLSDELGMKPEKLANKMRKGGKIPNPRAAVDIHDLVARKAQEYGIDPNVITNLVTTESNFNPTAVSPTGAKGIMQFMPGTAKQYGVQNILNSTNPDDVEKVVDAGVRHFKGLVNKNGGDYRLALAAYNGGQGAVNYVKKQLGKSTITGDEWLNFMENRRATHPTDDSSAWQNQTYDYVKGIHSGDKTAMQRVRQLYYSLPPDVATSATVDLFPKEALIPTQKADIQLAGVNPETGKPDNGGFTFNNVPQKKLPSLADRNKLGIADFIPELAGLMEQPDSVPHQRFTPHLFSPYNVSFQDKLNANNSSFKSVSSQLVNNPEALSTLAAQKYEADNNVLGEQFRTNQGIASDIYNKNIGLENDADRLNLQLQDTQYQREAQARSNTRAHWAQAAASISNKVAQNRAENNDIRLRENLSGYRPDENMNLQWMGGAHVFTDAQGGIFAVNPITKTVTKIKDGNTTTTSVTDPLKAKQVEQNAQKIGFPRRRR